jgi:hypothetical protein
MNDQQTETIKQFARQVTTLCAMLEDHCAYTPGELASTAAGSLSLLITAAPTLPTLPVDESAEEAVIPKIDAATTNYIQRNAEEKLGAVSSDVTNLYCQIKPAQMLYWNGTGAGTALAIRDWKRTIPSATNIELVSTLSALAQKIKAG